MRLLSVLGAASLSILGVSGALVIDSEPDVNSTLVQQHLINREKLIDLEKTHRQGGFHNSRGFRFPALMTTQITSSDRIFPQQLNGQMRLCKPFGRMRLIITGGWLALMMVQLMNGLQGRYSPMPGR